MEQQQEDYLVKLFRCYVYNYSRGMISVSLQADSNPSDSSHASRLEPAVLLSKSQEWMLASNFGRTASTFLCLAVVCQVRPRLGSRASARATGFDTEQEADDPWEVIILRQLASVGSALSCCDSSLSNLVESMLKYEIISYICEGVWPVIPEGKQSD